MDRTTRCQCGALRAKVTGEPVRVIICHCIDCQGRTGAAFSYNVRFERTQVQLEGTGCCYEREARGSRKIRNYFCPTCGTTVYWELDLLPTLYGIAAALFEEKPLPLPRISIWEENLCGWAVVPHGIERLQNNDLTCKGNLKRERAKTLDFRTAWMAAFHVRRDKAALFSGCKAHPATAPAGSNRGRHGGDEMSEAPG